MGQGCQVPTGWQQPAAAPPKKCELLMLETRRPSSLSVPALLAMLALLTAGLFMISCRPDPADTNYAIDVLAYGLANPVGMARLDDGTLFLAEQGSGQDDRSGGVSLVTPNGQIGRFISGIPSEDDEYGEFDLFGVTTVAAAPDGSQLYLGGAGIDHLYAVPLPAAAPPQLADYPMMPADLDMFMLPSATAAISMPFDITFDARGFPLVTDLVSDSVLTLGPDGTARSVHEFDPVRQLEHPDQETPALAAGISWVDGEIYLTLMGDCAAETGGGSLIAIDESGKQRLIADKLHMPIDVAAADDGSVWILEFAAYAPSSDCFQGIGFQQETGRLSRLTADGQLEPVVTGLNYPTALLPLPDGSFYITELVEGRLLHITLGQAAIVVAEASPPPARDDTSPAYRQIADVDAALAAVIREESLQPNPGASLREADTPLARLGQALFFDPLLSGDQNISCASCHHPAFAMGDGRVLPIGTGGTVLGPARDFLPGITLGPEAGVPRPDLNPYLKDIGNLFAGDFVSRNSPTIINAALLPVQFWDGRVESYQPGEAVVTLEDEVNQLGITDALAAQAMFPVTSLHEMAGATYGGVEAYWIRQLIVNRIAGNREYQAQFEAVFGEVEISAVQIVEALAAFERRFILTDAPWDAYLRGESDALTAQQKRGALLFFGQRRDGVNCAGCHSGDLFTDLEYYNLLVPQLGPGKGHGQDAREDFGRGRVTFDYRDQYSFRTPSLRNVALSSPYFHSGAYPTLTAVIEHHADVWGSAANYDPAVQLPSAFHSSVRPLQPERQGHTVAESLRDGLPLSQEDVADLAAFLDALTDPAALELDAFTPESVPSGLPLDPLPPASPLPQQYAAPVMPAGPPPAAETPLTWGFTDATAESGLNFNHLAFADSFYPDPVAAMGSGLCWLDYNNDGWLDLYLVNSYGQPEWDYWRRQGLFPQNGLFKNVAGDFQDVSILSSASLSMRGSGCVAADFNNDGWVDIYVTADGPNALLWNQGDGTFIEGAADAGVALSEEWSSSALVADLNGDGWQDMFVAGYADLDFHLPRLGLRFPAGYAGLENHLYLNQGLDPNGDAYFVDVAQAAGLLGTNRTLSGLFSDLNGDGNQDLYLTNDRQPNQLYLMQPWPGGVSADPSGIGFRFLEMSAETGVGDAGSGLALAAADYDQDGWIDLFINNRQDETAGIYRNVSPNRQEVRFRYSNAQASQPSLGFDLNGWGVNWADFDHDTDLDLLLFNGGFPVTNRQTDQEPAQLFGGQWAETQTAGFADWSQAAGLEGIDGLVARGSGAADYDNDGDLDIAVNQVGGPARLLRNDGGNNAGSWLVVDLGAAPAGAFLRLTLSDGRRFVREGRQGSSYLSSEDPRIHFGLGDFQGQVDLWVRWPDGRETSLPDVALNQHLRLTP